jgi:gliding motility-associated lipoprotein GldD
MKFSASFFVLFCTCTALVSCNSGYTPKPKGYFRIDLPKERKYQLFNQPGFPYTFEYPTDAVIIQDSTFFNDRPENDYWINVDFPQYRCKFYLSYNIISGKTTYKKIDKATGQYKDSAGVNTFDKLVKDAFDLSSKHIYKASAKDDSAFRSPNNISGVFFKVGGNAASPMQFFVTDSVKHFMRGSLYFDASPNADSVKPVASFLFDDMRRLINTLQWR